MQFETVMTLGALTTLVLTILVYVLIMPASRYGRLNGFGKRLHRFFQFKKLYLESVIKFIYVVLTIACVSFGFFCLFGRVDVFFGTSSTFGAGICVMIFGPIVLRLLFENIMLVILLVKNTIEINNRLGDDTGEKGRFHLQQVQLLQRNFHRQQ